MRKCILIVIIQLIMGLPLFSQVNLDSLLVAHYPFNGNANDESGNGNDGTPMGATLVEDRFGNPNSAYSFDGFSDYIEFGDVFNDVFVPFSISVWVYKDEIGVANQNILKSDNYPGTGTSYYYGFWLTTVDGTETPTVAISYGDGGVPDPDNRRTKNTSATLSLDEWMHLVVNVNGPTDMTIYFNTIDVGGTYSGYGGGMVHNAWTANMGKNTVPPNVFFRGMLDDIRIYNRALNQFEIQALNEEEIVTIPEVITSPVTNITQTSATTGGNVLGNGGAVVTERGVCWSSLPNPTLSDDFTVDGGGLGPYVSNITDLTNSTAYYVRAYATNSVGTAYGNEISFTTGQTITSPVVITDTILEVTDISATIVGNVTDDGGAAVIVRGVCWSTDPEPTTEDSFTNDGSGLGTYTSYLTGLTETTMYYVRAYATNSAGTSYGNQLSFTTLEHITGIYENPSYDGVLLHQNYPNPFSDFTNIGYSITEPCYLSIIVFNSLGRVVKVFDRRNQQPGEYTIEWDGIDANGTILPEGMYFYQINAGKYCQTKRMIILR